MESISNNIQLYIKAVYIDEKPDAGNEIYNPYQIPPNWDQAKVHREARRVSREIKSQQQNLGAVCECCGYEINRTDIDICSDIDQFDFLGSGFPMFYNFFQYSLFMLFQFFMISGGFNLVTNLMGSKCKYNHIWIFAKTKKKNSRVRTSKASHIISWTKSYDKFNY